LFAGSEVDRGVIRDLVKVFIWGFFGFDDRSNVTVTWGWDGTNYRRTAQVIVSDRSGDPLDGSWSFRLDNVGSDRIFEDPDIFSHWPFGTNKLSKYLSCRSIDRL